jgi:hypothetical protein
MTFREVSIARIVEYGVFQRFRGESSLLYSKGTSRISRPREHYGSICLMEDPLADSCPHQDEAGSSLVPNWQSRPDLQEANAELVIVF